jgi:hypothetical protein
MGRVFHSMEERGFDAAVRCTLKEAAELLYFF